MDVLPRMKIAVCMSGQLRNWEIAKKNQYWFWSSAGVEVDYFIHTWNYSGDRNGVSQPYEWRKVDVSEFNKIVKHYGCRKSIFDTKPQLFFYNNDHWSSLFYSFAQSVMLKRQYEIENNFEYDLVVKTRPDVAFNPKIIFTCRPREDNIVYSTHGGNMENEFHMFNPNDCVFSSSSYTMDLLSNVYSFRQKLINEKSGCNLSNFYPKFLEHLGPGIIIAEYCRNYGITPLVTMGNVYSYLETLIKLGCPENLDLMNKEEFEIMDKYFRDWYLN